MTAAGRVPYRRLPALSGLTFLVAGFLARLPASMGQLGTLTLVGEATGSYAMGGAAAGALGIATAIGSPLFGSLADRHGQRPVLLAQVWLSALGFLGLVLGASSHRPGPILACAVLAGLFVPQVGVLARVRWRALVDTGVRPDGAADATLVTAYAYEGVVDELGFVLGPALVGVTAAVWGPAPAVLAVCGLLVVAGTVFALHPTARIVPVGGGAGRAARGPWTGPLVVSAAMFGIGCLFGSLQTATTVFAGEQGVPGAGGLLYALNGLGSAIAGFAVPRLPARWGPTARLRIFAAGMLPLGLPVLLATTPAGFGTGLFVLGLCLAPWMITCYTLIERLVKPEHLAGATSLLPAAVSIGYALGASLAGGGSDAAGSHGALLVAAGAVLAMNAVAWVGGRLLRRVLR